MFVAEFLAVGIRLSALCPGQLLRSALGCKNVAAAGGASAVSKLQAAENQRKNVLVFARRVRRECVRLLCLVSVGVGASLRRWFAWASARSLRQNWRWLKLVRTENRGRAAAPNLGPRFLLATKSGSAPPRSLRLIWCRMSSAGNGLVKPGLSKKCLEQLCTVHFNYMGSQKPAGKEQKAIKNKLYADLWEEVKHRILRECGVCVGHGAKNRIAVSQGADLSSPSKEGQWRYAVFCPHPWRQDDEDLEDPEERKAKRAKFVAGATQEQSMGRPGYNPLREALVPLDEDALLCVDKETRSEWDALNPFASSLSLEALPDDMTSAILPETHAWTLRVGQGGISHADAIALIPKQAGI